MSNSVEWVPYKDRGEVRRTGPHTMTGHMKRLTWRYCKRCGLIELRNHATRQATKRVCEWWE